MIYALYDSNNTFIRTENFEEPPTQPNPVKGLRWEVYVPTPYIPTEQDIINSLTWAVQSHLDTIAREKNYDGILSACTYVTSSVPQFAAEGAACVVWRDDCWAKCYEVMAEVKAGTRAIPTADELVALMPVAPW